LESENAIPAHFPHIAANNPVCPVEYLRPAKRFQVKAVEYSEIRAKKSHGP